MGWVFPYGLLHKSPTRLIKVGEYIIYKDGEKQVTHDLFFREEFVGINKSCYDALPKTAINLLSLGQRVTSISNI